MDLIIVPDDDLVRTGGRLTAALGESHSAMLLSRAEFDASAAPPTSVGVIFLGDHLPDGLLAGEKGSDHGARWGMVGNRAWVSASAVPDPQATLDAMGPAIAAVQSKADKALADSPASGGLQIASRYLDPKLRVPAQTVAAGRFAFTPERMCWERQYTLGVVQFLADGFDVWAESITG